MREGIDMPTERSRIYGFVRKVFTQEIDEIFLDWCREQAGSGLWSDLGVDIDDTLKATDIQGVLENLAVDFCQLFVTPGSGGTPHESLYVQSDEKEGKGPLLWGDAASNVKDLYRKAGFGINEDDHQIPDALGVEFEFMERLALEEAKAAKENRPKDVQRLRDLQCTMLTEHLSKWVPTYARARKETAQTDFYQAMLSFTADFVEWDTQKF